VPRAGEVRVRVHAAAANPADVKIVRWTSAARFLHAKTTPLVPGYDFSGVVDEVGPGVRDLSAGDAVFGHLPFSGKTRQGTFSELITVRAGQVAVKPDGVEHETAAAAATVGLTALQALDDRAGTREGARVLVLGASGGVGSLALGIAKRLGAHVTGACSPYATDFVRDLGADDVIDRKAQDPLAPGRSYDVVFDTTGYYAYRSCARVLTRSGVFVTTMPSLSFVIGKIGTLFSARRCLSVIVQPRRDSLERLGGWLADGLTVPVAHRYPARDAVAALERVVAGKQLGKIVLDVARGF
jgi:alcohol dehydrogenase